MRPLLSQELLTLCAMLLRYGLLGVKDANTENWALSDQHDRG